MIREPDADSRPDWAAVKAAFRNLPRHARVWWKPNQRTVADILADYPDILDRHFLTVPRDTQEARRGA